MRVVRRVGVAGALLLLGVAAVLAWSWHRELRLRVESGRRLSELVQRMCASGEMSQEWISRLARAGDSTAIDPRSGQPFVFVGLPASSGARSPHAPEPWVVVRSPLYRSPAWPPSVAGEGGSVAFLDGHVEWMPRERYEAALAANAGR